MKAAQATKYGGQDAVVVTDDAPKPAASKGEVVIEVYAASVNPFDIKVREGLVRAMAELSFPATLGSDVAGIVSEIGDGVSGFSVGQEVYGQAGALGGRGSFAEYTTVVSGQLASKPKSIDFVTAAALPVVGASAYQALIEHIGLQAGQKILIHGGAGGIGSVAVQIAKEIGAYVAATASANDAAYVRDLGADEVIDYASQDFSELLKDYDAVLDTVGGETYSKSFKILKAGGKLVSMVMPVDDALAEQYKVEAISQGTIASQERLSKVADLVDAGALKINVDKIFPLEQAAEAIEYLKTSHPRGKVVIRVK